MRVKSNLPTENQARLRKQEQQELEPEKTERPFAKSEVMQQLLVMMQKISAEPNNDAHPDNYDETYPDIEESEQALSKDNAQPTVPIEVPESTAMESEATVIKECTDPAEVGEPIELSEVPEVSVVSEIVEITEIVETKDVAISPDDSDKVVIHESVKPTNSGLVGVAKRWWNRAVSWLKRKIGY